MTGDSQSVKEVLGNFDKYTVLINEKDTPIFSETPQFIEKPVINQTIIRGEIDRQARIKRNTIAREKARSTSQNNEVSSIRNFNGYLYGFCTWYVANIRTDIATNWGNAKYWLRNAQRDGFQIGFDPKVGAILATNESWAGHVAYVESIDNDTFTITEMNKIGWNRISNRTLNINSPIIRGFIYSK